MGRSVSKGPYIAYHLLNKINLLNEKGKKENPKLVSLPSKKSMNRKGKTQNGMNTHNKSTLINHVKKKA